jgi:2-haloacid dehalogenase
VSARMRWITFDCYGTLVDWHAGFATALGSVAGEKTADVLRAYHAQERRAECERPHRSYRYVLATSLVRAAAESGVPVQPSKQHVLTDAWPFMRVFDDVEPMLAELRSKGWRLAVLTNCDEDLFANTHRMFRVPFDLVLTAERVQGYKPAPWHFRAFEMLTRVDRRDWVHVACGWYHDIAPAQSLGIQHVWLDRDRTGEQGVAPSVHVHSATEVPGAVDLVTSGVGAAQRRALFDAPACC